MLNNLGMGSNSQYFHKLYVESTNFRLDMHTIGPNHAKYAHDD